MVRHVTAFILAIASVIAVFIAARDAPGAGQEPKYGGVLKAMQREELPVGFAIHESTTISTIWPAMPCFNNLVLFDPMQKAERADTIVGDLAERWSWQDGDRTLVFFLRKGVSWHDGKPFTSADVKSTFDMVREAPDARAKLRTNPHKEWYANVDAIETPDPFTVLFRLKRPQPSLIMMLAGGHSPVYPAHVPPAEFHTRCIGTGPFKLKEWRRGESVEYVRNADYFVKGRPYLDGIKYFIISERGTRTAALQSGRLDVASPDETPKPIADQLKAAVPQMVTTEVGTGVVDSLILNTTRPPFNDVKVRRAVSRAIDRRAYIKAVRQDGSVIGSAMAPPPFGAWGLLAKDLAALPEYSKPAEAKAEARKLLAEAGFTSARPLKVEISTRALSSYRDLASFVAYELKQAGIETTLRELDTVQWFGAVARKEYQLGANLMGVVIDDPDVNFYENYGCGSVRNYTGYCNEAISQLIDQQSRELDPKRRLALVRDIQRRFDAEAVRPMLGWRLDYFAQWAYVKNLVPHHSNYSFGRMQNVWLDR
jgi:peptide/nickel transport system substrate-binding protein